MEGCPFFVVRGTCTTSPATQNINQSNLGNVCPPNSGNEDSEAAKARRNKFILAAVLLSAGTAYAVGFQYI